MKHTFAWERRNVKMAILVSQDVFDYVTEQAKQHNVSRAYWVYSLIRVASKNKPVKPLRLLKRGKYVHEILKNYKK
jgi:hypothetical protein